MPKTTVSEPEMRTCRRCGKQVSRAVWYFRDNPRGGEYLPFCHDCDVLLAQVAAQ